MRAGRLRQKVSVVTWRHDESESGELIPREELKSVSANVQDVSGGEQFRRFVVDANATTLVEMRWRSDVAVGSSLRYGDRTLNVISLVDDDGRKRKLIAQCKDVRPARG